MTTAINSTAAGKRGYTTKSFFFFFNDTATTEIYTLSLHDALPIRGRERNGAALSGGARGQAAVLQRARRSGIAGRRSEEHTSELQSRGHLVCRLLLEKKNTTVLLNQTPPNEKKTRKKN